MIPPNSLFGLPNLAAVSYTHLYVAGIGTQIAAVFGFVTNFFEMATGGSYESNFIPHLFLHTWSLALEVHYYVLWALLAWF